MIPSTLIWRNVRRRKMRLALTITALAIAFLIFGVMAAIRQNYSVASSDPGQARLIVASKVSFTEPLPFGYVEKIQALSGVAQVSYRSMALASYGDEKNVFVLMAVDPQSYMSMFSEYLLSANSLRAFRQDLTSFIAGKALADRFGWKIGAMIPVKQRLTLQGQSYVVRNLRLVGIFGAAGNDVGTGLAFFHYRMFNEQRVTDRDTISAVIVRAGATDNETLKREIDTSFLNSPFETSTLDEDEFSRALLAQMGDIRKITSIVIGAGFFSILLIVGSSMSASVRERQKEIAVLRVLGFTLSGICLSLLAEAFIIVAAGAMIGLTIALLAIGVIKTADPALFGRMAIMSADWVSALALVIIMSLVVVGAPTWRVARTDLARALVRRTV